MWSKAGEAVQDLELAMDDRAFLVNARPLPSGGAVLVIHDLTEMRRLEAVRRDFVANVSHELKTPLTSISGYAETLLTDRPDRETTRQFLGRILGNARRMQELVDDLLDLSRIESGRWQPARTALDVEAVAREAWAALAARSEAQSAQFIDQAGTGCTVDLCRPRCIPADSHQPLRQFTPLHPTRRTSRVPRPPGGRGRRRDRA